MISEEYQEKSTPVDVTEREQAQVDHALDYFGGHIDQLVALAAMSSKVELRTKGIVFVAEASTERVPGREKIITDSLRTIIASVALRSYQAGARDASAELPQNPDVTRLTQDHEGESDD
jgi:hypothetical protein